MSRHPLVPVAALVFSLSLLSAAVQAQTIERAKLTDSDMNCAQLYSEVKMMEMVAASVAPAPAAAPVQLATAAQADVAAAAGGQVLSALAQQAGSPNGLGGLGGLIGGLMGGGAAPQQVAGALNAQQQAMALAAQLASQQAGQGQAANAQAAAAQIGALQALAQNHGAVNGSAAGVANLLGGLFGAAQAAANAAPAAAPVAAVAAAPAGNAALAQQAGARKDHLTGLFLAKGCKLSEVQR